MSWKGYVAYDGLEIINVPRTLAYARKAGLTWVKQGVMDNDVLHQMLGHDPYEWMNRGSEAPWFDAEDPDSYDFQGVLVQNIAGLDDSTREGETIEFTTRGGAVGRISDRTKTIVFSLVLVASSDAGADFGLRWLKSVTSEKDCSGRIPETYGGELTFAKAEPMWAPESGIDPEDCWRDNYERRLLKVRFTEGPTPTGQRTTSDGGAVWMVTMTAVAGDPLQYGNTVQILDSLGSGAEPYAPGFTGAYNNVGYEYVEGACSEAIYQPLYDPLLPALVAPPSPPDIPVLAVPLPSTWTRRYAEIPASAVDKFDEMRLTLATSAAADVRNVRFRIYETEDFTPAVNCGHVGVFLETYIPANSTFYADGVYDAAYVDQGSVSRRADTLIFGQWIRPVEWFSISCRKSYTVVMDVPPGSPAVTAGLYLTGRSN